MQKAAADSRFRQAVADEADIHAEVVELVDTLDLGSSAAMCGGSYIDRISVAY